jgi:hypothetical protein
LFAILRLILLVPFAYALAVAAAGLTVTIGVQILMAGTAPPGFLATIFVANTTLLGAVTFVFAGLAIIAAEAGAVRSLSPYLAAGAALGLAAGVILFLVGLNPMYEISLVLYTVGGLVGGLTYWLIAGMHAGAGTAAGEHRRLIRHP